MLKNNKKNNNNDNNNYRTKTVKCRFNLFPGNHILIFAITVLIEHLRWLLLYVTHNRGNNKIGQCNILV